MNLKSTLLTITILCLPASAFAQSIEVTLGGVNTISETDTSDGGRTFYRLRYLKPNGSPGSSNQDHIVRFRLNGGARYAIYDANARDYVLESTSPVTPLSEIGVATCSGYAADFEILFPKFASEVLLYVRPVNNDPGATLCSEKDPSEPLTFQGGVGGSIPITTLPPFITINNDAALTTGCAATQCFGPAGAATETLAGGAVVPSAVEGADAAFKIGYTDSALPDPAKKVTFHFTLAGTAALTTDYTLAVGDPATQGLAWNVDHWEATFFPDQQSLTLFVKSIDDALVEGNESVVVQISGYDSPNTGSFKAFPLTMAATILDNDAALATSEIVITHDGPVNEGDTGTMKFTYMENGIATVPSGNLTIKFILDGAATAPDDFTLAMVGPGTLGTVAGEYNLTWSGSASTGISIATIDDTILEGDHSMELIITELVQNTATDNEPPWFAEFTIIDNDGICPAPPTYSREKEDFATCPKDFQRCGGAIGDCCTSETPKGAIIIPLSLCHQSKPGSLAWWGSFVWDYIWKPSDYCYPIGPLPDDMGILEAYGLVYRLMQNDIPVHWAINPTKRNMPNFVDLPEFRQFGPFAHDMSQGFGRESIDFWVLSPEDSDGKPPVMGAPSIQPLPGGSTPPVYRLDPNTLSPAQAYPYTEFSVRGSAFIIMPEDRALFDDFFKRQGNFAHLAGDLDYDFSAVDLYEVAPGAKTAWENYDESCDSEYPFVYGAPISKAMTSKPAKLARIEPNSQSTDNLFELVKLDDPAPPGCTTSDDWGDGVYCSVKPVDVRNGILEQYNFAMAMADKNTFDPNPCSTSLEIDFVRALRDYVTLDPGEGKAGDLLMLADGPFSLELCAAADYGWLGGSETGHGRLQRVEIPNYGATPYPIIRRHPNNVISQMSEAPFQALAGDSQSGVTTAMSYFDGTCQTSGVGSEFTGADSTLVRLFTLDNRRADASNPLCTNGLNDDPSCDVFARNYNADHIDQFLYYKKDNNPDNGYIFYSVGDYQTSSSHATLSNIGHLQAMLNTVLAGGGGGSFTPFDYTPASRSNPIVFPVPQPDGTEVQTMVGGGFDATWPRPQPETFDLEAPSTGIDFPYIKGAMVGAATADIDGGLMSEEVNTVGFAEASADGKTAGVMQSFPQTFVNGCAPGEEYTDACRVVFTNLQAGSEPNMTMIHTGQATTLYPYFNAGETALPGSDFVEVLPPCDTCPAPSDGTGTGDGSGSGDGTGGDPNTVGYPYCGVNNDGTDPGSGGTGSGTGTGTGSGTGGNVGFIPPTGPSWPGGDVSINNSADPLIASVMGSDYRCSGIDLASGSSEATYCSNKAQMGGIDRSVIAAIEDSPNFDTTRPTMIYTGGLDGMLHAFCGEVEGPCEAIGQELWAFLPRTQLGRVRGNSQRLDGSPKVTDAFADFDGDGASEWKTVLAFQTGVGNPGDPGAPPGIYALDVTDPTQPNVLWEKSTPITRGDFELGTGLGMAVGSIKHNDKIVYAAIVTTTNGGTAGPGLVTAAIDLATGEYLWTFTHQYPAPRTATNGPVPADAIPAPPSAVDMEQAGYYTHVVVPTVYGQVFLLDATDGSNVYGSGKALFSFSSDHHPIGAAASIYRKQTGGALHAVFTSGGYVHPQSTSWAPAGTEQFVVAVKLKTTATLPITDVSATSSSERPLVVSLGTNRRVYGQGAVVGTDFFFAADHSIVSTTAGPVSNDGNRLDYGHPKELQTATTSTFYRLSLADDGGTFQNWASLRGAGSYGGVEVNTATSKIYTGSGTSAAVIALDGVMNTDGPSVDPLSLAANPKRILLRLR